MKETRYFHLSMDDYDEKLELVGKAKELYNSKFIMN